MDLERLYDEYFTAVYRFVLSISRNHHVAEEVTQETFFKALKKVDSFRGDSSLSVWLCQIAKNIYYDSLKRQKRGAELSEKGSPADAEPDPELSFFRRSEAIQIHKILHQLNEPYKEVFSLRAMGELPFGDIGELFGKSEGWARVTYHRAKLMIREELENEDKL